MTYKEQLQEWLDNHPEATAKQAIEAGYWIASENYWTKRR